MLLAINIGNTNITHGIFDEEKLIFSFKTPTKNRYFGKIFEEKFRNFHVIDKVVIGSVVPNMTKLVIGELEKLSVPAPLVINSKMNLPIKLDVDYPDKVGIDLIANMVAAQRIYNKDLIIVDSGTATTFCSLSKEGIFGGSIIAIGLEVMSDSLSKNGAQLPQISIEKPGKVIGKNTVEAMQTGIYLGYIDLVDGMIKRLKNKVGDTLIIGTGGNMELIAKDIKGIDIINKDLVLEGLRIIYQLNR